MRNARRGWTENGAKRGKVADSSHQPLLLVGPAELGSSIFRASSSQRVILCFVILPQGQWLEEYFACAFSDDDLGEGTSSEGHLSFQLSQLYEFVSCSSIPRYMGSLLFQCFFNTLCMCLQGGKINLSQPLRKRLFLLWHDCSRQAGLAWLLFLSATVETRGPSLSTTHRIFIAF